MSWLSESNNKVLQERQSLDRIGSIGHNFRSSEGYVMRQNEFFVVKFFLLMKQTIWSKLFVLKPKSILTEAKAFLNQTESHNTSHKKEKCIDKFLYLKPYLNYEVSFSNKKG